MKKIVAFSILFFVLLTLVGCNDSQEDKAKKVAEEFIINIHTVDDKKVAEYKEGGQLIPQKMQI